MKISVWRRVTAGCAALAGAVLLLTLPHTPQPADTPQSDVPAARSSEAPADPLWTLGVFRGRVARFRPHEAMPAEVYDLFVAALPAEQQQRLAEGIPVHSEEELWRLLEDCTG